MFTFHVAFSFVDDECIAAAASVFVADNADTFDIAVAFEFASKVGFCCCFVLWKWSET